MTWESVLAGRARAAIVHGENLAVMRVMPPASVHLVYGDAPYATGDDFTTDSGEHAYSDRWPSLDAFLDNLRERSAAARDLLTEDGTFVLQVDPSTSHYVKVMLDGVFGRACFDNEIIWRYRRWPVHARRFQRMHDVLFRYRRSAKVEPRWNQLYDPLAPSTVEAFGNQKQKHQRAKDGGKWARRVEMTGEVSPGSPMSDVWEIPIVAPSGSERVDYPTQKPEALANRVISACSLQGDVVLDPWCGSGTHVAVAVSLWRRGIGIDESPVAFRVASGRIARETQQGNLFAREC